MGSVQWDFFVIETDIAAARAMQPATARKPMELFVGKRRLSLRMYRRGSNPHQATGIYIEIDLSPPDILVAALQRSG